MPPTLPQGFGTLTAGQVPEPVDPGLEALEEIRDRVAPGNVWRDVPINLASGASQYYPLTQDVINALTVTVKDGDLWIYRGNRQTGPPHYRVLAGSTLQFLLPPNVYDWTWLANGAQTDAMVILGTV